MVYVSLTASTSLPTIIFALAGAVFTVQSLYGPAGAMIGWGRGWEEFDSSTELFKGRGWNVEWCFSNWFCSTMLKTLWTVAQGRWLKVVFIQATRGKLTGIAGTNAAYDVNGKGLWRNSAKAD